MIHAYSEIYLDRAMQNLASMLDYAVHDLGFSPDGFFSRFIACGAAEEFGRGDYRYLSGMSGIEIACCVMERSGLGNRIRPARIRIGKTPEYWAGWVLAYYQWWSALTFDEICWQIKPSEVVLLYNPFHEMDISSIAEKLDERCRKNTRLKNRRLRVGMSQSQLAKISGIPVRTIQQYEQRERDISKAQAITVASLAAALGTRSEMLLENSD